MLHKKRITFTVIRFFVQHKQFQYYSFAFASSSAYCSSFIANR